MSLESIYYIGQTIAVVVIVASALSRKHGKNPPEERGRQP